MDFNSIYHKYFPAIKRLARSMSVYIGHIDEDDILQEMRIRLWREYVRGALSDKTDSYIMQNLWFHAKNYLRKNKVKIKTLSLDAACNEDGVSLLDMIQDASDSKEKVMLDIAVDKIRRRLNRRQKEVFDLRRKGYTLREVAKKLGISHVRVYKLEKQIKSIIG